MAINVAHEPDPRLIAQAGYMTGIGKAYLRERDYYDKQNQQEYARYVDEYNRRKQLEQEQYNRSQDTFNRGLQLDDRDYERSFAERGYQTGQEQQQFQNELSADAHARQWEQVDVQNRRYDVYEDRNREQSELRRQEMAAKYNAEYKFTPEQEQQQHRLQQQIQSVQLDPTLNDQERAYALQQLQSQFDAIQPQLVPKQGPTAQEQFEQSIVTDPNTGMRFIQQPGSNGTFKFEPVQDNGEKAEKMRVELDFQRQKLAMEMAQKEEKAHLESQKQYQEALKTQGWFDPAPIQPAPFSIPQRAKEIYEQFKAFDGQQQPAAQPQQQPAPQAQPGVAQVDQGAQQNAQARAVPPEVEQLFMQYQAAKNSGNMELANQLKQQLLVAREAQMQPM